MADSRNILNEGQKDVSGYTANGNPIELGVQVTEVAKTFVWAEKMKDAGNIVIIGADDGDMIINESTGMRTPIMDTGAEFVLDIYVPGGEEQGSPAKLNPRRKQLTFARKLTDTKSPKEGTGMH